MSQSHTPGPWSVEGKSIVTQRRKRSDDPRQWRIQVAENVWKVEDAHLIAAAPDLLAACEEMAKAFERVIEETRENLGTDGLSVEAEKRYRRLRSAIAKAGGAPFT